MQAKQKQNCNDPIQARRGGIMVVAMVCLVLTTLILGSLLKLVTMHHTQSRFEQQRVQADWLAEAGLERAADNLSRDAGYSGENWQISAEEIGGTNTGSVEIAIKPSPGNRDERIASVVATFPADTTRYAKRSKTAVVRVPARP